MSDKAGIWIRVSSGGQDEANQVPDIEAHCAARGYDVVRGCTYTVHAKSAYHGKQQPALDKMLADMRAGRFTVLVVWHSSRLERRKGKALLDLLAEVEQAGGRVDSVQEPTLGQLDFGSQVTTFLAGLMNHEKSRLLVEQVGAAQDRIRGNRALDGRPPWGYATAGEAKYEHRLVPAAAGQKYVPQIFDRVIAGESQTSIARWLDAEGVRPASGSKWWARSIGAMVRNPVYTGHRQNAEGVTVHECAELVSATAYRLANAKLAEGPKRGPVDIANRALLADVARCPRCADSPMYRIKAGNRSAPAFYYRCSGRGSQRKGCGNMVPLAPVDTLVDLWAANFDGAIMAEATVRGHDHQAEIDRTKMDLRSLDMDAADYDTRHAALRARLAELRTLPVVPDRTVYTDTGKTYAGEWAAMAPRERGNWLAGRGIVVYAARTPSGLIEQVIPALALAAMGAIWSGEYDGVSVAITWLGAGIDDE